MTVTPPLQQKYFATFLKFLFAYALVILILFQEGDANFERLHLVLDTSNGILSLLLAVFLLSERYGLDNNVRQYLSIGFGLAAVTEILHALVGIEWSGSLEWIHSYSDTLRPASWPPSTYVLPFSIIWMLWLDHRKVRLAPKLFAIGMVIVTIALFVLALSLPKYVDTGIIGIHRPTQIPLLFLWVPIILMCWRDQAKHPLYEGMVWMGSILFLSDVCMLYSTSPHEKFAMMAHMGKLLSYMLLHLIQMQIAVADSSARNMAEVELRISSIAFDSLEGMVITDANNVIIKVNQAFMRLTGYSREELINRNMSILKSGYHDAEFYASMWGNIISAGTWQGEIWNRLKNGEVRPHYITITAVTNNQEVTNYVTNYTDITERKAIEEKLNNLAFYDPLTQLPNRVLLADRIQQTLARCRRNQEIVAVCMLDLDGFKKVNDTLGHASGDQLLCDVAQRLQECIRQEDTAARFGGDEFALLLGGFTRVSECEQTLERINTSLSAPYQIFGQMAHITASIGVALFPEDGSDPDLLLRLADQVMYEVKKTSKNGYKLFNSAHARLNQTNLDFLKKISEAFHKGQFELYYQPKVDCRQCKVVGAEALVRWNHPILGLLLPSEFIPLIERNDLIIALGEWTIQEALRQLQDWREAGISIQISVNISARQLHNQEFPQRLQALLAGHDSEIIKRLELEIVETAALEDVIVGGDAIRKCRAMGVRVSLDDFGTGFSSLAHLKHLAADTLKIDLSFISGMLTNAGDMAIVEGVIGLAASFRLQVIAEGVEYVEQILLLMELGCDVMQGYELARPMPAKQIPAWLAAFTPDPLWSLSASQLTSRDYFALLLAEVNHRQWTNQVITNLGDTRDQITPESLLDHSLCRFGQWCCDKGASHFHNMSEFHGLDAIHQNIHQTAADLLGHYQMNRIAQADADRAQLLDLQHNMTSLLHHLRSILADDLLK